MNRLYFLSFEKQITSLIEVIDKRNKQLDVLRRTNIRLSTDRSMLFDEVTQLHRERGREVPEHLQCGGQEVYVEAAVDVIQDSQKVQIIQAARIEYI